MKIAVPSSRPDLDGLVANRLGTAAYLLVIETSDMSFEAMDGPPQASGPGAGVMAMSMALNAGAKALLVGHLAPHVADALRKQGIAVQANVSGPVRQAVAEFMASKPETAQGARPSPSGAASEKWADAAKKGARQFYSLLPRLVGVILLLGLFQGFVSKEDLLALFSGLPFLDALWGASLGGLLAGNPINSYVIGESLLSAGVSLSGVLALMMAWVSVGMIQLPAEAEALGVRFAVARNLAALLVAVLLSYAAGLCLGGGT